MSSESLGKDVLAVVTQPFLSGSESGALFERRFMDFMREHRGDERMTQWNSETDDAFDRIFTAVDVFCADEGLRGVNDFDENGLRVEVFRILNDRDRWVST